MKRPILMLELLCCAARVEMDVQQGGRDMDHGREVDVQKGGINTAYGREMDVHQGGGMDEQ